MTKPIHHQNTDHQALHPAPSIDSHMGYSCLGRPDPVQRAERNMTILNPCINNNGGSLYDLETFCIVHRYEPEEDKQRRENAESGRGYITDAQIAVAQNYSFYSWDDSYDDYYDSCYFDGYYDDYDDYLDDYYGYECDEDDMECSFQMLAEDEDFDEDNACMMNSVEMGDCLPEENVGADWGFDETDPEYEAAEAEEELEAGTGPSPAIESSIHLSTAFSKATSPEEDLPDVAPETAPRPLVAANNASYQLSA